jgi:3-hydroxyisobutyrate dehydrogenase-like beta-hydroxyacid dehydrogenase
MAMLEGDSGMSRVAFLGTGLLGSGMVEAMLRRRLDVAVWNRTESKARALEALGATVASTPEEAVAGAAQVHMALSDDAAVDQMMARIADRLGPETIVADHTTTSPAGTRERLAAAARRGIRFLHAPVFMSPQMCRDAQGLMLVSGPADVFTAAKDALAKMTGEVWYVGERQDLAAAYKIFGNSMLFVITAGIADVFAMAKHVGVPAEDAAGLFSKFRVGGIIPQRAEKLARADFEATFELTMARKDIRLMIEAAGPEPLVVLPSIATRMDEAIASGYGKADMGAIAAASVQVAR